MGTAYIYYAKFATAPGSLPITVALGGCSGTVTDLWADEFSGVSGLDTAALPQGDVAATSGSGTTINTPTLTPSQAGDALYNACLAGGNISTTSGGWTLGTLSNGNAIGWMITPDALAHAVSYSQSGGSGWACLEAAFK